jgi:hypothetical protein
MMKKIGSLLAHGLVTGGMVYALIALSAVPAAACTPTECANIQRVVGYMCEAIRQCDGGGHLTSCNSAGFEINCFDANGGLCGGISGRCAN